jgi:hypothetical protein
MNDDILIPDESSGEDRARSVMKAAGSLIPFVGPVLELFIDEVWVDPYRRRVNAFLTEAAERLVALDVAADELADDEHFQTIAIRAVAAAARTHEAGKLESLRNAILNVALKHETDEAWALVLLDLVDELTEAHFVALEFLRDPRAHIKASNFRVGWGREQAVAQILDISDERLVKRILGDLDSRRGLTSNVGGWDQPGQGITDIGERLLAFIRDPTELEDE